MTSNYYSHHCSRIKSGIIIGYYLRALRMYSSEDLPEVEIYIYIYKIWESLKKNQYPYYFISNTISIQNLQLKKKNTLTTINWHILPTNLTSVQNNLFNLSTIKIITTISQTI